MMAEGSSHGESLSGAKATASVLLLAMCAGATDPFAFLQPDGVSPANMTGNLALAGMFTRTGYAETLQGAGCAVVGMIAGIAIAELLSRRGRNSNATLPRVRSILLATLVIQAMILV